jgi:hypothetical protein
MEIIMRQMLVFAFFQVIVLCRSLAAILVLLTGMGSAMAQTQAIDTTNPANEVIVKSGHFMVRDHLVIDLQHGVEWMRCSVGQIWNGTDCEGVAMQLTQEDVAKAIVIANAQLGPGWRLPSRAELEGLVCKACAPVKIELDSFPNTLGEPYWTGEVNGFAPRHIWTVNFMTGHTYGRFFPTQQVLVRLVRDR